MKHQIFTGQLGQLHEAIGLLQQAVSLQPDHFQAISELAKLLQKTGQLQASAETLREVEHLYAGSSSGRYRVAGPRSLYTGTSCQL